MNNDMQRWYEATFKRCSVRRYLGSPSEEQLHALREKIQALHADGVRIALEQAQDIFEPMFLGLGKIKGTSCFAAIAAEPSAPPYLSGYLGEVLVLECVSLGLCTCWVSETYRKEEVAQTIQLKDDETLLCVIAIGVSDEPFSMRPRKSMPRLTGLSQREFDALPAWMQHALLCARNAPSMLNAQPWRFVVNEENSLSIIPVEKNYGSAWLDCGIAMLHLELGAAHGGVAGEWQVSESEAVFVPIA